MIIKLQQTSLDFFLQSNLVGVNRLFVLVYTNQDAAFERFKGKKCYLQKGVIDNYNIIINGKNAFDQPMDFDIKRHGEIRKLTTVKDEDYAIAYLLNYEYIKSYYRLIAVDISKQKDFYADPKTVQ